MRWGRRWVVGYGQLWAAAALMACGDDGAEAPEPGPPSGLDAGGMGDTGEPDGANPDVMVPPMGDVPDPGPEPMPGDVGEDGVDPNPDPEPAPVNQASELIVNRIEIGGRIARRESRIAGLTWFGDVLVALPRFPNFVGEQGVVFGFQQGQIVDLLEGRTTRPPITQEIRFDAPGIEAAIPGFAGFEAIVFGGFEGYLTAKGVTEAGVRTYVLRAEMNREVTAMTVDVAGMIEVEAPTSHPSLGYEAMSRIDGALALIPGTLSPTWNDAPQVAMVSSGLEVAGSVPVDAIEYRITDATQPSFDGIFWTLDVKSVEDTDLVAARDPLVEQYGQVESHRARDAVERLVAWRATEDGIERVDRPPIYLKLHERRDRLWEGVAALGSEGFLVITQGDPDVGPGFCWVFVEKSRFRLPHASARVSQKVDRARRTRWWAWPWLFVTGGTPRRMQRTDPPDRSGPI